MNVINASFYKPPTGFYKVNVLSGCDWKGARCVRLGISVGGKNHEGERLFALMEWVAARFEVVEILVADSLQRHNIMFAERCDERTAMAKALEAGEQWLERNAETIGMFEGCTIHRLEDFRKDETFGKFHRYLLELFETNADFRRLVERDIKSFWTRRSASMPDRMSEYDFFFTQSRNYILEELAIMQVWDEKSTGVEVYPGSFLQILSSPERLRVEGLPHRLRNYPLVEVSYIRNKGYQAADGAR